ncbi:acyl-CoA dehydrogenase [Microbispora rosea subsp. aerata]|nr:acyl-CoA dehydrogenase [Microbispora rosea subsp. aerata]GIH57443.1 acyl-CoA dehydrogenase [Microbispora rosea subsp. aerata]GLJ86394.1 acyl-CoA dehydrogenase [Microbispora rosea subsp. aerata]
MRVGVESLSDRHAKAMESFLEFTASRIAPYAGDWDNARRLPRDVISALGEAGHLGALVPAEYGGSGMDLIEFGLLNEAIGTGCSSVRSVVTVHSMVCRAVQRWGSREQRERWLPRLASGEWVGAFALSEPGAGNDAARIGTTARRDGEHYVLDGTKKWITYAQAADVFLVFGHDEGRFAAFLVERDTPGLTVVPIDDVLGTRASMLAELRFTGCRVPRTALLGRVGFGLSAVATDALEIGRYSVAWGSVGLAQACLEASVRYAGERRQFGAPLIKHQLIQRLITDMATSVSAARLLCVQAGELKSADHPDAVTAVWMAKYFASTAASRAASDAVQIQGANGCDPAGSAQRLFRDAKIAEIIEGSTQIQQTTIASLVSQAGAGED